MIASYKRNANIAAVDCRTGWTDRAYSAQHRQGPLDSPLGPILFGIYMVALLLSFWWYIKAKGRSGGWIFMVAFHVIGLLVILLLKDRAKDGQLPAPPAPPEFFG